MTTAIEFIGSVIPPPASAPADALAAPPADALADPDYPVQVAGLVDEAGFDKLLVGYDPHGPDGLVVANGILTTTSRLGVVVPVVPGLVAPTVAARQLATLAAFHRGRISVQVVMNASPVDSAWDERTAAETTVTNGTVGTAAPPGLAGLEGTTGLAETTGPTDASRRDGPTARPRASASASASTDASTDASTRRAAEFLEVVELTWAARQPFDYAGEFYQVTGAASAIQPGSSRLPVYLWMPGADAVGVGTAHADFCIFSSASVPVIIGRVADARAAAARHGWFPRFGVSVRLLAAPTERAARDRLEAARPAIGQRQDQHVQPGWLPPAALGTGAAAEPSIIAGSYDQVAEVLLGYIGAGVSSLVIEHDPHAEAADCAAVIERVRATVRARLDPP
jgi:alkanesulfonate monooxygenase